MEAILLNTQIIDYSTLINYSKLVDGTLIKMIAKVSVVASSMSVLFVLLSIGYHYIKNAIGSISNQAPEKIIDIGEIARLLVTLGMIAIYIPLITAAIGTIEIINDSISFDINGKDKVVNKLAEEMANKYIYTNDKINAWELQLKSDKVSESEKSEIRNKIREERERIKKKRETSETQIASYMMLTSYGRMVMAQRLTGFVLSILGTTIAEIAKAISVIGLKVLLVVGPLAFAFSIIPAFRNQVTVWASATLNFAFVSLTISVIRGLDWAYLMSLNVLPTDFENSLTYNLTKIVIYTMPFWFTSKFVGKGEGGAFVGKAMGLAAAGLAMIMTGGSAAAAGSSNLGSITKAGSKALETKGRVNKNEEE